MEQETVIQEAANALKKFARFVRLTKDDVVFSD